MKIDRKDKKLTNTDKPNSGLFGPAVWEGEMGSVAVKFETGGYCAFDRVPSNGQHQHSYFEICLVLSGSGTYLHGDEAMLLKEGDLFLAAPGVSHEISSMKTRDLNLVFLNAVIRLGKPSSLMTREERLLSSFLESHHVKVSAPNLVLRQIACMEGANALEVDPYFLSQQLKLLGLTMISALTTGELGSNDEVQPRQTLEKAVQWIDAHIEEPIRVADLARAVFCSERTLQRLFAKQFQRSVKQIVDERKIAHACLLLLMRFPVSEVAERCGMDTPAHFSRYFKSHMGCSPKNYQMKHSPAPGLQRTTRT